MSSAAVVDTLIVDIDLTNETFWESPKMNKLFGTHGSSECANAIDIIKVRMENMKTAFATVDGCKGVLEDANGKCACTPNDMFRMRLHCQCMCLSLIDALDNMNKGKKWIAKPLDVLKVQKSYQNEKKLKPKRARSKYVCYKSRGGSSYSNKFMLICLFM